MKKKKINFELLLKDFVKIVEQKYAKLWQCVFIKTIKNKNWDFKSFRVFWKICDRYLNKNVIERDLKKFLNWKIISYKDIKPIKRSKLEYHWNAWYYFYLFLEIENFFNKNKNKYLY